MSCDLLPLLFSYVDCILQNCYIFSSDHFLNQPVFLTNFFLDLYIRVTQTVKSEIMDLLPFSTLFIPNSKSIVLFVH